jgi:hypothetical protein
MVTAKIGYTSNKKTSKWQNMQLCFAKDKHLDGISLGPCLCSVIVMIIFEIFY